MMKVRIAPELPIKLPTTVSMGLLSINPSAHKAHPEYEFKTVIATGISAAPILLVMFHPKTYDVTAAFRSNVKAIPLLSVVRNQDIDKTFKMPSGAFKYCE